VGGKLVGAGGGGFLMFYAKDKDHLKTEMSKLGLVEVRFQFEFEGTKVILS
jgi:D-glycero-alpha-D-manno-heptose-7-phosphate kinase